MGFSSIPMPVPQSAQDSALETMGNINSLARDYANEVAKLKKLQMDAQLSKNKENRTNQLFPEELKKAQIQNQLLKPQAEADIANKNANTNRLNFQLDNPLYGQSGPAGQIGAAELLKKYPQLASNPQAASLIMNALNNSQSSISAQTNLRNKQVSGYDWNTLPVESKNNLLAQGRGMGLDDVQMKNYISQGLGIRQIAEKEGLDPDNLPKPVWTPTTATKTRTQLVDQVGAELSYLSSATTPIIKRYAKTYLGISPAKLKDQLSSDPEAQKRFGEYVGALAAQSGIANTRNILEGGKAGVEVMRDIRDKMLAGIDTHSPFKMSDISYQAAQDKIDSILEKGAKIRTSIGMNPYENISNKSSSKDNDPLGIR